jgi:hypothetical protein
LLPLCFREVNKLILQKMTSNWGTLILTCSINLELKTNISETVCRHKWRQMRSPKNWIWNPNFCNWSPKMILSPSVTICV